MPVRFEKDPKTGKYRMVGSLTADDRQRWANQPPPPPAKAPTPKAAAKPAGRPWWWHLTPAGIGNELAYRSKQTARFNKGQVLISGSTANPLMGGDPVYYDTRKKPGTISAYSPGLRSNQQVAAGVLAQAPANAALAAVNLGQRLLSGQPLKPQKPESSAAGRAVISLQNTVTKGLGATPPSQLSADDRGYYNDLPSSLATNAALAFAPFLRVGSLAGVVGKASFLSPGAQAVLARSLQWGVNAGINEAASGILDNSTQGQAGDLLKAAGAPVPDAFLTKPEDDRISAGVKGIIPGVVLGGGLGLGLSVATKAADLAPNALRNLRERRLKSEVEGARAQTIEDGLQEYDPETGEHRFTATVTQPAAAEVAPAAPAAVAASPDPAQAVVAGATGGAEPAVKQPTLAEAIDGRLTEYGKTTGQEPDPAAEAVDANGAASIEAPELVDPTLPEIDAAAIALGRMDDDQLVAVHQDPGPVLPALEQQLQNQQLPEPNPAVSTRTTAAPTESLAEPLVGYRDQWEALPTAQLQGLAHPDVSPDLFERVQGLTGRDWQQFTRTDVIDGLDALRLEGQTVIPNRLRPDQNLRPVDDIQVDPARFQFKQGTDAQGQQKGNSLSGVQKWNPDMEGAIQTWVDPMDGNTYVVNGHNRLAKAKELGIPTLRTEELLAATPEQARAQGAIANIASGGGTVFDAAKFLRDSGITDPGRLAELGIPLESGFGTQGLALAQLPGNLFQDAIDGRLSLGKALALGGSGLDEAGMQTAAKALNGADLTDGAFNEVLQQAKSAPTVEGTQVDLFGNTEVLNLMVQKGQLAARIRSELISDKNLFGKVGKNADKLQTGGNQIDAAGSQQVAMGAQELLVEFDATKYAAGTPLSEMLNEGAQQIAAGAKVAVVAKRIKAQLLKASEEAAAIAPKEMNLEQFAAATGGKTMLDVNHHQLVGLRSAVQTKTGQRARARELDALMTQAKATEEAYQAAIQAGEIVEPKNSLERTAAGHDDNASVQAARRLIEKTKAIRERSLSAADRKAIKAEVLARAIGNGEVRPSASPLVPTPDAPAIDVNRAARDLEEQLARTGTVQPDSPAAQLLEEEARLAGAYSDRDAAIAQEVARAGREADGYQGMSVEERIAYNGHAKAGVVDLKPSKKPLTSQEVVTLEDQVAFAKQQEQAALAEGNTEGAMAWREEVRRAERARIMKAQQGMDASQQGLFGVGEYDETAPLLNQPAVAPVPVVEIPAGASKKITAKTSESRVRGAAESLMSWANSGVPGTQQAVASLDEALALVRAKGAILDPDKIPGLAMDAARNEKAMGRATADTEAVGQAYRQFYGVDGDGAELSNAALPIPAEAIQPFDDLDQFQQAKAVADLNRALGTNDAGLNQNGGYTYSKRMLERKGQIDLAQVMGADAAKKAEAQFASGKLGPEAQQARQTLRDFYGFKEATGEKPLYIELGGDDAAINQVSDQLREIARRVSGADADVKLMDHYRYTSTKREWGGDGTTYSKQLGSYHLMRDVVTINGIMEGSRKELLGTTFHESFHRLQYGLLTENEMKVMDSAFGLSRINNYTRLDPAKVATIERQAVAFQNYATARAMGGNAMKEAMLEQLGGVVEPKWANRVVEVAAAFEKVLDFLERVKNAVMGRGFTSIDDIFERAYAGQIAKQRAFDSALTLLEPNQVRRAKTLQRWSNDNQAPMADISAAIAKLDQQIETLKAQAMTGGC